LKPAESFQKLRKTFKYATKTCKIDDVHTRLLKKAKRSCKKTGEVQGLCTNHIHL